MATIEQLDDLYRFAIELPAHERDALSIDELYEQWRSTFALDEDVDAIQEALDAVDRGAPAEPAEEFLSRERAARSSGGSA
ncbi:hypothetical protein [Botrimarina sp.]|uniref:hypothetical protein n=1 Tax=Botrimarina sp. TaxID=2795802 RepID=UPI0032EC29A9